MPESTKTKIRDERHGVTRTFYLPSGCVAFWVCESAAGIPFSKKHLFKITDNVINVLTTTAYDKCCEDT